MNNCRSFLVLLVFLAVQLHPSLPYPFTLPDSGRWVVPTVGEVWPKPQQQSSTQNIFILRPSTFQFQLTGEKCDIIDDAIKRYYEIIFYPGGKAIKTSNSIKTKDSPQFKAFIDSVEINLKNPCEQLPREDMIESYGIRIDTTDNPLKAEISSDSVWGILRGLETFSQLVYSSPETGIAYQINGTRIVDFPRFTHRGLLIDTSRHYFHLKTLKKMTDLLAQNKMNVFHWHMSDDSTFSYESQLFPDISRYGTFKPSYVYTFHDIREIIEYARLRGIRVIPEFDVPGHTQSWGKGVPGLLTECYDTQGSLIPNKFGPINPTREENMIFLQQLFGEVCNLFPDNYLHLGGDEVVFDCWATNPEVKAFMAARGWGENWGLLEQYFIEQMIRRVTQTISPKVARYQVWQEIIDDNAVLPADTIVNIWKLDGYQAKLDEITKLGYPVILSSPWYLNKISYGIDWDKYYVADPYDFNGTDIQKSQIIGGEAAMWSEFVDSVSLVPRTWPRASAVAERLWSDRSVKSANLAAPRLEEHRCRLLRRGYNVDPVNGVNFCEEEWDDK